MTAADIASAPASWLPPTAPSSESTARRIESDARLAAAGVPRATPSLERRLLWERRYRNRLIVTDVSVIGVVTIGASLVHLSVTAPEALIHDPWILARIPVATAAAWLIMLTAFQTRMAGVVGSGSTEYKRVAHATGLAFGVLSIAFIVFQWQGLRNQLMIALPVGLIALLLGRWRSRRWLVAQRREGHYRSRALVVGRRSDVEHVIETLQRDGQLGFHVVGTALDGSAETELVVRTVAYPVLGTPETVARVARETGADTIIVASQLEDPEYIRRLSWQLEGTAADLVLSSRLTDVAGPRISLRQIEGLPLVHVRVPSFEGSRHAFKRALDIVVSALALIPIAVITPILALLIVLDSPGGVFFRQRRVGQNGREFEMIKFRTMRATAEQELAALVSDSDGDGLMFKMRNDPRVTKVGAVLRRFSLDELPQFWNVLRGDMSVVGPRPPLPSEVGAYAAPVFRRLYIKPGITGLWQVSGRSDLSWEESVRLDLHYVENWSTMTDLLIMARTAQTMIRPRGAY